MEIYQLVFFWVTIMSLLKRNLKKHLSSKYIQGSSTDDLKDLWDVYELSSFKITFIFRAPTEQLASVAIEC